MSASHQLIILLLALFAIFLTSGYPIAFVLGGTGILVLVTCWIGDAVGAFSTSLGPGTLGLMVKNAWSLMDNQTLIAVPTFIFMGLMLERSGIAERMMLTMQKVFGRMRGGLAVTVVLIGIILAASTGIIGASIVVLGLLALPAMLRQGYDKPLATGTICSAGTLGILMPPSIMLVVMSERTATSVGDLFMGAVFPALILGGLYIAFIVGYGWLRPAVAPPAVRDEGREGFDWKELGVAVLYVLPALGLIVAVLGSILLGWATPTEASGIGAGAATLLALVMRRLDWTTLRRASLDTCRTTGYIFAIFVGATIFSTALNALGGNQLIETGLANVEALAGAAGVIVLVLLVVFLLGFVLDWIEITIIILPIVAPIIDRMELGIAAANVGKPAVVWFVVLMALCLQTSFLTPPVGFALFFLKGVAPPEVQLKHLYKGIVPFVVLQLIGLTLVALFPAIVTWLPSVVWAQ